MGYKFKDITILVVDSQPALLDLIRGILQMFGCKKIITTTAQDKGLALFREYKPDLMIVDWELANSSGISFTKSVRSDKENPYVPIIFMTALSSKRRVAEARDSGINEFLAKPFTAESLYKRIEAITEKPRYYVKTEDFNGPNRRRRNEDGFDGQDRRQLNPKQPKE